MQIHKVLRVEDTRLNRFNHLASSGSKFVWITGEKGAVRMSVSEEMTPSASDWTEFLFEEDSGVHNLVRPFSDQNGKLYGNAEILKNSRKALVCFDGNKWKTVAIADNDQIFAFVPYTDDSYWIIQGPKATFKLIHVEQEQEQLIGKSKVISGEFFNYQNESNGVIWIATGQGVARYTPPLWKTPPGAIGLDRVCHSIYEDTQKRLWFLCQDTLVVLENHQWKKYPLPDTSHWTNTDALCSLPEERLAIVNAKEQLMSFDPIKGDFTQVQHPEERRIDYIASRGDGTYWITSTSRSSTKDNFRIELFDGRNFKTCFERNFSGVQGIFHFMETEDGNLWLGGYGLKGIARLKDSEYSVSEEVDGFPGDGAYCGLDLGNGRVWIGARDTIYGYQGGKWEIIRSGLEAMFSMIKARDNSIWVASATGLHRFYQKSWVDYSIQEGLPDAAAYEVFEDGQGRIWAGTGQGIFLYDSGADTEPPIVMIDEKNQMEISSKGEAQFTYSGIDKWKYTEADRLLYSHRIDEGTWSSFGDDEVATFTKLAAGTHQFQVRAMDRNWNISEPISWDFQVLLPWYKEPGFWAITTISTILILCFAGTAINRHYKLRLSYETLRHTQNQLIQSEKMASLGKLVAGVAHEINNPVNFIKSNIEPMKEYFSGYKKFVDRIKEQTEKFPKEMKDELNSWIEEEDLEYIGEDSAKLITSFEDGSTRIAGIVNDLRQYSRIDDEYHSNYDLHEAIDSTLNLLENQIKSRITVHKNYCDDLSLSCSPGKMSQVFMNLLKNAIDAIEEEGNIWISTRNDKEKATIIIRDDGKGIPKNIQSKIFDPFFTTKPVGSGTGLGLSITYSIIEQHGGTIEVESEEEHGTTFTIRLPMEKNG